MSSYDIQNRLNALRQSMKNINADYYLVPTCDFHNSEYVSDYFKCREFLSGFTGSNGTLLVWSEGAGLWTDGRYFVQAKEELEGTGITLFRMYEEGVPTIEEFLEERLRNGESLCFDGRVVPANEGIELSNILKGKYGNVVTEYDLCDDIWTDRPSFPATDIYLLPEYIHGEAFECKIRKIRKELNSLNADGLFISKLDDIAWLLNLRANDTKCNPVFHSHILIFEEKVYLFVNLSCISPEVSDYLKACNIECLDYFEVYASLSKLTENKKIFLDFDNVSYELYRLIKQKAEVHNIVNPTEKYKAIKNTVEQENMKRIYLKDSVAVTKFIYWLKTNIGKETITEMSATRYLDDLRKSIPEFLDLSFDTISGYASNGAIVHYEATSETNKELKNCNFLLVDSGGQYMGGTTDVTRTVSLGEISDEMKRDYTLVLKGHLQIANARFLYGCTGKNLDILAREALWKYGLDYKHGTGHGVGYILNVHEGLQNLRWKYTNPLNDVPFEAGMTITDEPGLYIEGKYGIRIENVLLAQNAEKNEYGQFMRFDNLTLVPMDKDAIDYSLLTPEEASMLNAYQTRVYSEISPFLSSEEREWLYSETMCM